MVLFHMVAPLKFGKGPNFQRQERIEFLVKQNWKLASCEQKQERAKNYERKRQLSLSHVTENGWQRGIWTIERMTVLAPVILNLVVDILDGGLRNRSNVLVQIFGRKTLVSGQNSEVFLVWPSYTLSIAGGCNCLPMWIWLPVASAQWRNADI